MRKSALVFRRKTFDSPSSTSSSFFTNFLKYIFLALIVGICAVLIWLGWQVWLSEYRTTTWEKEFDRFNLLILIPDSKEALNKKVYFVSIGGKEEDSYVAELPAEHELQAWNNYGRFRITALPQLYALNGHPDQFFISQLAVQTGLIADVELKEDAATEYSITDHRGLTRFFSPFTWWSRRNTLALSSQVRIWRSLEALRNDQVVNVSEQLEKALTQSDTQANMSQLNFLQNTVTAKQGESVAVVNLTGINGLGGYMAEVLGAQGFRVVHVSSDGFERNKKSEIIVPTHMSLDSRERFYLSHLFPEVPPNVVDKTFTDKYRTEYVVVFGEDFNKFISEWQVGGK